MGLRILDCGLRIARRYAAIRRRRACPLLAEVALTRAQAATRGRAFALTLFLTCTTLLCFAQQASFLYIQGDKKTPFYVKLEGEMQPRYGKHYCIIPDLEEGIVNLEILFQQNIHPAQTFTVRIPAGGERGFLLVEKESTFSLYDLTQNFYIAAGNDSTDDLFVANTGRRVTTIPPAVVARTPAAPAAKPAISPAANPPAATPPAADSPASGPRFIPGITLGGADSGATASSPAGGCGGPMDVTTFAALYRKALDIDEQDDRLVFLSKQASGCYSPTQLRLLGRVLDRDAARFTFLKNFQGRLTNAARFRDLEDLLQSEAYKVRFRELLTR